MTDLSKKIVMRGIDTIAPYELNAKLHEPKQVAKIAESIKQFGWTQPIVVDKNGSIIAGHGRRLAAISLGLKEVPVLVRDDLSDEEVKALRLADNRVALSGFDGEKLQAELASLQIDMEGIFDKKELEFMQADLSVIDDDKFMTDVDAAVREQAEQTIKKIADADAKEIAIAKALGFKNIKIKDEKHVAAFIAIIESETGKSGAEAFVEHAQRYAEQS